VYFGRNLAKRYDALARALHDQFPLPLLRASFERRGREWRLVAVRPIAASEIPEAHRPFVIEQAELHFGRRPRRRAKRTYRYDLAMLVDPEATDAPSDPLALRHFERAARELGIAPHRIGNDEGSDIAEYDALFIRETTYVNHPTYRIARRAASEGLAVIDDPVSILRCTNKVFLAELFVRHGVPHPETVVAHEDTMDQIAASVGLPCVLKRPDSAFSKGVVRVDTEVELRTRATEFLRDSELVIAQAFTPSEFDWRIGVLGGEPLYACRYFMASGHWQIVSHEPGKSARYGRVDTQPVEIVPRRIVSVAKRAAAVIGDGLYGVDVKEVDKRVVVIEVKDNPTIDSGVEDGVIKDALYRRIMEGMLRRVETAKSSR
jgi:glutathione synthase/RimK-type ligase-like ATP-grasp enzyme